MHWVLKKYCKLKKCEQIMKWLFLISFFNLNYFEIPLKEEKYESIFKFISKDTLTFDDLIYDKDSIKFNLYELDSNNRSQITDKIIDTMLLNNSLYVAFNYAFQSFSKHYFLFSYFITIDDCDMLFLVTTKFNDDKLIIDYFKIGENKSFEPTNNNDYSTELTAKAIRINNNKYKILRYTWNQKYYPDGKTDTLNTRIETSYIKIDPKGKFRKVK